MRRGVDYQRYANFWTLLIGRFFLRSSPFLHCHQGGFHLGRPWSIFPKEGREVNLYGDHGARPSSQLALSSFEFLSLKPPIFEVRRYE